ncbi:hypothetical protein CTA1_7018 [Colletotrichum tanaceti]|uniref:Uncharacterized protein n=1 Tax=Colletotrichum tanaceti TaxID=1306861 RepID=A0A4U6X7C9_9PEZI|nr:hypothetical protein CTA1_7018 [Colletotrichum tanaceti]
MALTRLQRRASVLPSSRPPTAFCRPVSVVPRARARDPSARVGCPEAKSGFDYVNAFSPAEHRQVSASTPPPTGP